MKLNILWKYINKYLIKRFLHSSHSSCEVLILFVKKSNKSLWLYIDYRGFNKFIIKNNYSLSLIEKLLDKLSNTQFFIKFNIHNKFNHLCMTSREEWKIIFQCHYELFEYIMIFFDLYNDFEMFQHYMNDIFRDFLDEFLVIYLNNLLVYFKTLKKYK